jgi:hypothetical protein
MVNKYNFMNYLQLPSTWLILRYDLRNGKVARVSAVEREQPVYVKVRYGSGQRTGEVYIRLVSVQLVRWCEGANVRGWDFILFCGKRSQPAVTVFCSSEV